VGVRERKRGEEGRRKRRRKKEEEVEKKKTHLLLRPRVDPADRFEERRRALRGHGKGEERGDDEVVGPVGAVFACAWGRGG